MWVDGSNLDALVDPEVRAALDAMPQGFAYYDAQDRCMAWNLPYQRMWRHWGVQLRVGAAFKDLLRAAVAAGRYPQAAGREEAWIADRLASRSSAEYRDDIEGPERTCYRMEQRRTLDGGRVTTCFDISELKRRERDALRAQAYLDAIVESVPAMLVVKDGTDGRFQLLNRAGEALLGVSREEFIGRTDHDLMAPRLADMFVQRDREVIAGGKPVLIQEEALRARTGEIRILRTHKLPIRDPEGAPLVLTVSEDITELKAAAAALQQARDRAEAANIAKTEFLTNMSHEIRTPLNGVLGLAEVLARTRLEAPQREMLEMILTSGRALNTLLSDILDLAKVEAGALSLTEEPFDLKQAVTEAAVLFEGAARDKGLSFRLSFDEDLQSAVMGDPLRLRQVVANLTSNAVKFTSEGQVSLHVQTRPEGLGDGVALKIIVRDTGPGFDDITRAKLFARFEQGDGSVTRRFGGTGLGLAIAAQLAQLMDGQVDCTSAPGRGSVFIFTARLRCARGLALAPPQPLPEPVALPSRLRVLLAEDHPTNQKVVELLLGEHVELTIEGDGRAAVAAFANRPFDLVLMDTQMPVMDGLAAIREIRQVESREERPRTPVISLTANAMPHQVSDCLAAGADLHLAKPITAEALFRAIDAVLPPNPETLVALVAGG